MGINFHSNHNIQRRLAWILTTIVATGAVLAAPAPTAPTAPTAQAADSCPGGTTDFTAAFAAAPDGLEGADYQRAIDLPDGRRLWTFQDAYVARPGRSDSLVHNVGVVQEGSCFRLLRSGTADHPAPWLVPEATSPFQRWFWPLAATLPGDGTVRIFLAEFVERGGHYLANSTPVATWVSTVDAVTLQPLALAPAPNPGPALYGWTVASDEDHTYLYGHCYRQFGFSDFGHDTCTVAVTVARTSHDLARPLEYWNGATWTPDAATAANIAPSAAPDGTARWVNPTQIAHVGDQWIAVTKEGDWWGSRIYLDVARQPTGPWRTVAVLDGTAARPEENTYFASIVDIDEEHGDVVIGLSHNRWDGGRSSVYRPTFQAVPLATFLDGGQPAGGLRASSR